MEPSHRPPLLALAAVGITGVGAAVLAGWLATPRLDLAPDPPPPSEAPASAPPQSPAQVPTQRSSPTARVASDTGQPVHRTTPTPGPGAPLPVVSAPEQPPPAQPPQDLIDGIEDYRESARQRVEVQLRLLARAGVDRREHQQARALLESELEHVVTLKRDSVIGGLDPKVAKHEYKRVRDQTDDALDELLGAALRDDLRALE